MKLCKFNGLISLSEASKLVGVTDSYLRAEIKRGKLINEVDCKKFGTTWVVDKDIFLTKYKKQES